MKRKMIFGVLAFLLILQVQTAFAADYNEEFCKELNKNNIGNIEKLLQRRAKEMNLTYCMEVTLTSSKYNNTKGFNKSNCLDVLKLLVRYGANVNSQRILTDAYGLGYRQEQGYPLENAIEQEHNISVIQFLLDSGANPNLGSDESSVTASLILYTPPIKGAYKKNNTAVFNLLLERGANGAVLLPSLGERGDNATIKLLISKGVQIRSDQGAEALRNAAKYSKFDTVKLLVENGVNVNARDKDGSTAASVAYDKGEMDIYDYLKANGARDFEPRQVAQQPASPSSPSQSYSPPPSNSSSSSSSNTPSRNVGREIADAFKSPLQSGTYSLAGTQEKISLAAIAKSGIISQTWQGKTYQGTYNIDGNRMTVQIRGYTFVFNITSETSFSGHGETWVRTGY